MPQATVGREKGLFLLFACVCAASVLGLGVARQGRRPAGLLQALLHGAAREHLQLMTSLSRASLCHPFIQTHLRESWVFRGMFQICLAPLRAGLCIHCWKCGIYKRQEEIWKHFTPVGKLRSFNDSGGKGKRAESPPGQGGLRGPQRLCSPDSFVPILHCAGGSSAHCLGSVSSGTIPGSHTKQYRGSQAMPWARFTGLRIKSKQGKVNQRQVSICLLCVLIIGWL